MSGYVLPVLMGLLGSMTYVLRRYLRSVGDRLLTPRDLREYIVRLVLGTVFGVAIGFFTTAEECSIANPVSSLGAPALAFLAGYGVEAVFRMLDGLADQFSPRAEVKWCPPTKQWPRQTPGLETGFVRPGGAAVCSVLREAGKARIFNAASHPLGIKSLERSQPRR